MADPLSLASLVGGMLTLGMEVTGHLFKFYTSCKDQEDEVARITHRLGQLLITFQSLDTVLRNRPFWDNEQDLIANVKGSVQECSEVIKELGEECEKFDKASVSGIKAFKVTARRAAYPFRRSTLLKLDEAIGDIRDNLSLALDILQLKDQNMAQDSMTEVKLLVERILARQVSSTVHDWLGAPDASTDHNTVCSKRHPGTGLWFIKSHQFTKWLTHDNSFLWLNGFAGCGKSVLLSTAAEHIFHERRLEPDVGIAFFYFTLSDASKQDESAMLRVLLLQLSGQLENSDADLAQLHASYQFGAPPTPILVDYLRQIVQKFQHVYILLDALNESPRYRPRDGVLDTLEKMRAWSLPGLHLLVTSRDEPNIRESLGPTPDQDIIVKAAEVDKDIVDFVSYQLDNDYRLRKWQDHRRLIENTLVERAQGMFRYVECQFDALKRCPRTKRHLDLRLQSAPRGLEETYERMLCSIGGSSVEVARRILALLCFSTRPLTVAELIHAYGVNLNEIPCLNQRRLLDVDSLFELCPGIIEIDNSRKQMTSVVRIAHPSIQEYLGSRRIQQEKAAEFVLQSLSAHSQIAQICLVYLLEPGLDTNKPEEFPLARFAALSWYLHYTNAESEAYQVDELVFKMFKQRGDAFYTWLRSYGVNNRFTEGTSCDVSSPIYSISLLELHAVLRDFIAAEPGNDGEEDAVIESLGALYRKAFPAASYQSHEKVMQLLRSNAEVDAEDEDYEIILQAASYQGYKKVVQRLMNNSAEGGGYDKALQAASYQGYEEVVQLLLNKGADPDAQGGHYGNALQVASYNGHEKTVQMLLNNGADPNAQGGRYHTALIAAAAAGQREVVQMLLDHDADVNVQDDYHGNALQAVVVEGHENLVRMLLDNGADVNAQCGFYGNALTAALAEGHKEVVRMLRDAGAYEQISV